MMKMREPETVVTFDTAAGLVRAVAACRDGRCEKVSLDMPPAFVVSLDDAIATGEWGHIGFDLCFGGVFYALIDVAQLGLKIEQASARKLAEAGVALRNIIDGARAVQHPELTEIKGVAYVMFRDEEADGAIRTCTVLRPGRVDRSPCGTGSNANLAATHARGRVAPGDIQRSRSIIGSEFETRFLGVSAVAGRTATRARISGRCWIYGLSQVGLDPNDPFPVGFALPDTWGPLTGELSDGRINR